MRDLYLLGHCSKIQDREKKIMWKSIDELQGFMLKIIHLIIVSFIVTSHCQQLVPLPLSHSAVFLKTGYNQCILKERSTSPPTLIN